MDGREVFEKLKKIRRAGDSVFNDRRGRSVIVAAMLVLVVLLSAGSGVYVGASFFPQQAPNVTITTTIYTTTTSWTTSTIWSTVTSVVQGVLTTIEYTTSTSTVTVTGGTTRTDGVGGTAHAGGWATGYVRAWKFTLSASGTITAIGANWYSGSNKGHIMMALYSDNGGRPGTLLAQTPSTAVQTAAGWQDVAVNTSYYATAGTYWLAVQFDSASIDTAGGTPYARSYYSKAYGPFDGTWSSGAVLGSGWSVNLRVTYTA